MNAAFPPPPPDATWAAILCVFGYYRTKKGIASGAGRRCCLVNSGVNAINSRRAAGKLREVRPNRRFADLLTATFTHYNAVTCHPYHNNNAVYPHLLHSCCCRICTGLTATTPAHHLHRRGRRRTSPNAQACPPPRAPAGRSTRRTSPMMR